MEEQKRGMDVAAVTVPPMVTSESNRISIIISPRAASSKVMPFELIVLTQNSVNTLTVLERTGCKRIESPWDCADQSDRFSNPVRLDS